MCDRTATSSYDQTSISGTLFNLVTVFTSCETSKEKERQRSHIFMKLQNNSRATATVTDVSRIYSNRAAAKDKTNWIKIIFLVHKLVFSGDGLKRACYWIYELVGPFNGWLTATLPIEVGDVTIDGAKTAAALQIGFLEIMAWWKLLHFTYFGMSKCSIYLNWR